MTREVDTDNPRCHCRSRLRRTTIIIIRFWSWMTGSLNGSRSGSVTQRVITTRSILNGRSYGREWQSRQIESNNQSTFVCAKIPRFDEGAVVHDSTSTNERRSRTCNRICIEVRDAPVSTFSRRLPSHLTAGNGVITPASAISEHAFFQRRNDYA
jgi:hypothetical protein